MKILWLGLEHVLGIEENHEVIIMNKDTFNLNRVISFNPDLVIEREFNDGKSHYEKELTHISRTIPACKKAVWLIDTHVGHDRHLKYAKHFDYIFLAISKYVPEFEKKTGKFVFWLPLCFPAASIPSLQKEKEFPIGFIGRYNVPYLHDRTDFLNVIKKEFPHHCHFKTEYTYVYQEMAKCNIMLNKTYADDMNFRVFEALACGNVLLTNPTPDMYKISGLITRVYMYKSVASAIEWIKDIMFNKIYYTDTDYITNYHMLPHRINSLLEMIEKYKQKEF